MRFTVPLLQASTLMIQQFYAEINNSPAISTWHVCSLSSSGLSAKLVATHLRNRCRIVAIDSGGVLTNSGILAARSCAVMCARSTGGVLCPFSSM